MWVPARAGVGMPRATPSHHHTPYALTHTCMHPPVAVIAAENTLCPDYVSEKVFNAVGCGAIPIVRSRSGVPAFDELLGPFPRIDAGELSMTDFVAAVRRVMSDDGAYKRLFDEWHVRAQTLKEKAHLDGAAPNPEHTLALIPKLI